MNHNSGEMLNAKGPATSVTRIKLRLAACLYGICWLIPAAAKEPVQWVDPFIGTEKARWFLFAPAAVPFGMVKLAPDTSGYGGYAGGGNTTGYRYSDSTILGFSHLHEFQIGGILIMPTTGPLVTLPGTKDVSGWRSQYLKSSEHAEPGYYAVELEKYKIKAELTATTRAGYHRYTFPSTDTARVLIDVGHPLGEAGLTQLEDNLNGLRSATIERLNDRTLRAECTISPPYLESPVTIHAEISFNRPFLRYGAFRNASYYPGRELITGFGSGYYVEFDARENRVVEIQVGVSFVNDEQAHINREMEIGLRSFDTVRSDAHSRWNELLGRVQIENAEKAPESATKFYTALWHVLLGRGISSDANGKYLDHEGRTQQIPLRKGVPEFTRYNTDSLWGSFWNINQVWSLLYPEQMTSFAKFLLSVYQESGWLTDGYVVNQRAPGMLSNETTPFLAAAYARNPGAFDRKILWNAIWKNQTEWRSRPRFTGQESLYEFKRLGYAPCDDVGAGAAGNSLEFAYESWCAAQVALALNKKTEAQQLLAYADNWRNLWDPASRCFRPRLYDGSYYTPFNPDNGFSFAEGTARQYRWFVPQNVPKLIDVFGAGEFLSELEKTLAESKKNDFGPANGENTGGYA